MTLLKLHETTMRQNVRAFAPLTRYGFSSPAAPSEFIAAEITPWSARSPRDVSPSGDGVLPPHIPGARKLQTPSINAL